VKIGKPEAKGKIAGAINTWLSLNARVIRKHAENEIQLRN